MQKEFLIKAWAEQMKTLGIANPEKFNNFLEWLGQRVEMRGGRVDLKSAFAACNILVTHFIITRDAAPCESTSALYETYSKIGVCDCKSNTMLWLDEAEATSLWRVIIVGPGKELFMPSSQV